MILTMTYLLLIATLLACAAVVGERICAELKLPRRSVWILALAGSIVLPACSLLLGAPTSSATPFLSLPLVLELLPDLSGITNTISTADTAATSFSWPDWQSFNVVFIGLWAAASVSLLAIYAVGLLRVRRSLRRASPARIGDSDVLISTGLGPAVIGFFRPRIVLPQWLTAADSSWRTQVLNHERQHIAARDQLALLLGLIVVATMPWNVALWWQLRRLRLAIEVDCDDRVVRAGADPREYSQALFAIGKHQTNQPAHARFAAVALIEPPSELEKRIGIMLNKARQFSLAGFGLRSMIVVAVIGLAFAVNAPMAQDADRTDDSADATEAVPALRVDVANLLTAASSCLEAEDFACVDSNLAAIRAIDDLNSYERAQMQNFAAFVSFERDDMAAAMRAYQAILALPRDEVPAGLIASTTRNLSILHLQEGAYDQGLQLHDQYLALPGITEGPEELFFRAQVLFQMQRYEEAAAPLEAAIAASAEPDRGYYNLLLALQNLTDDRVGMLDTLEKFNAYWPDDASNVLAALSSSGATAEEYLPIVKVAPVYPARALQGGLEGYVIVQYTVGTDGETKDVVAIESSEPLFEAAAIESARKYKYKPRLIDGTPVEVAGVTTRIEFALRDDA